MEQNDSATPAHPGDTSAEALENPEQSITAQALYNTAPHRTEASEAATDDLDADANPAVRSNAPTVERSNVSAEVLLWRAVLDDLALQMTRTTFEKWLQGSTLEQVEEGYVVRARDRYGAEWLEHRLARVIGRTLEQHTGSSVTVQFASL